MITCPNCTSKRFIINVSEILTDHLTIDEGGFVTDSSQSTDNMTSDYLTCAACFTSFDLSNIDDLYTDQIFDNLLSHYKKSIKAK